MSKNMTESSSRSGGCGCGGGSSKACQCGKSSCDQCKLEGFVRPRFFSGQLLTEEDLQLLDAYTVAKNRLHNRQFWGDGVVCGLKVTKHPCNEGSVLVSAGYALDCCGNDIVVACEQELDVNRMIRDLRTKLKGGYDCGDPCGDKKKKDAQSANTGATSTGTTFGGIPITQPATTNNDDDDVESVTTRFCLYLNYCESESDPVAPYATGDACGASGCEPSRVREGFKFELRCDDEEKPRPSIKNALCKCVKDEDELQRAAGAVTYMQNARARFSLPNDNNAQRLEEANKKLEAVTANWTIEKLDATLSAAEPVIVYSARVMAAPPPVPIEHLKGKKRASAAAVRNTPLGFVAALSNDPVVKETLARRADLQRAEGEAILQKAALLVSGNVDEAERSRLASGLITTPQLMEASDRLIGQVRGRIAVRSRIPVTKTAARSGEFAVPATEVTQLMATYTQYEGEIKDALQACFCDAILPPCGSCDDQGVLLACLEMLDCEVVEICNLERRFVLTPVTLRYWFPEIDTAFEALENQCCGRETGVESGLAGQQQQSILASLIGLYWRSIANECVRDQKSFAVLAGDVQTQQQLTSFADAKRIEDLEARLRKLEQQQQQPNL
jgi:hypothetical protein